MNIKERSRIMDQTPDRIRRRISMANESLAKSTESRYSLDLYEELLRLQDMNEHLDDAQEAIAQTMASWFDFGEGGREAELEEGYKIAQLITANLVDMGWVVIPSVPPEVVEEFTE